MSKQAIICPKCKGKGTQLDKSMVGITNIFFPIFWTFDQILTSGEVLYKPCSRCDGAGWINIGDDD